MLIAGRIRKASNSYVVTIPPQEMETRGLQEGQLIGFDPVPMEPRPMAPPRLEPDEEADSSEDMSHEQVMREFNDRTARDIASGVLTQSDLEQARDRHTGRR